jgi:tripartite-type tricarboxylate transporter receptor subunit TctC
MRFTFGVLACLIVGAAFPALAQTSKEPPLDPFYAGKTIDFIVGASPGGGYGLYAALLARHLGRHIPGDPTIVTRLMPGAGSLNAANEIYTNSAKDGTVIGAVFTGAVVEPLIGDRTKARYDSRRFGYIGSSNRETIICFARPDAGIKTWANIFKKQLIVGAAGWTSSIRQYPAVLDKVLGAKFKIISGYPGSREAIEAVEKGEVQGTCGIQWSSFAPSFANWIRDGKVTVFGQIAAPPGDPTLNAMGVPNLWDFVKSKEDREVLGLIFNQMEFGRPYITPPGVPPDRLRTLRAAFDATMEDPKFLADAKRANLPINPMQGKEVQAQVDELYSVPENLVTKARQALE